MGTATVDDIVKYLGTMIKIYILLAIIDIITLSFQAQNGFSPTAPNVIPILEVIFYLINVVCLYDISMHVSLFNTFPPLFSLPAIIILNVLNLAYHNRSGAAVGTLIVSLIVSIISLFVSGSNTYVVYHLRQMLKRGEMPSDTTAPSAPTAPTADPVKAEPDV